MTSSSTKAALRNLKKLKPTDGWSVETNQAGAVRLCRRSVPLTSHFFLDLYCDNNNNNTVVGILKTRANGQATAQVLVTADGTPVRGTKTVSVAGYNNIAPSNTTTSTTSNSSNNNTDTVPVLSDEQNMQLIKFGCMAIGGLVLLKVVLQAALLLYILAMPILYLYLVQHCPTDASLDVKRELKRVLRGSHLPDDHPAKPKGLLSETLARLQASVTAEVATGLMGYEVTFVSLAGAATVACVAVPAARMEYFWVGVLDKWYYVYSREQSVVAE